VGPHAGELLAKTTDPSVQAGPRNPGDPLAQYAGEIFDFAVFPPHPTNEFLGFHRPASPLTLSAIPPGSPR
jgi:hypothetical protein